MKKILFSVLALACIGIPAYALENDSLKTIRLGQVDVYSPKETNLQNAPVSSTTLGADKINQSQIFSIRDISGVVPNFYIPDYGSCMSASPYVRGVGSRNSGQSIALYVDNVPYPEKSAFDFELYDLAQIEVLRGPQGTLYGRNSIGGIVNMYTLSPLNYQGVRASVTAGNYGMMQAKASYYTKLGEKTGFSAGGYYGKHDGFYKNDYTSKNLDAEKTAGARVKFAWTPTQALKLEYATNFDYVDQGAFPYGLYNAESRTVANPNFNDASSYRRKTWNNSLSSKYIFDNMTLTVSLAHQYFDDQMNLDQDFSPASIFTLQQNQKQQMLNGEAVLKSAMKSNYSWLFGLNGFGQRLDTSAPVSFREDGIRTILQPVFTKIGQASGMTMTIKNPTLDIPGTYDTKRGGGAMFHQSTFRNILVDGLSLTVGARLDIEKVALDYNSSSYLDIEAKRGQIVMGTQRATAELIGTADTTFVEFLPKAALKYEWDHMNFVYGSISRGYKTGGFNIQMISDLVRDKLQNTRPGAPAQETDVKHAVMYQPEHSWNYEAGIQNAFLDRKLRTSLTLFYMDIKGLQLTEFVASGAGRMLTNAGSSTSKGVEFSADMQLGGGFSGGVNYGYAHATFRHFTQIETVDGKPVEVDYSGKYVPYAPQQTANVYLNYVKNFENSFLSQFYGNVSYSGIGKIYWQESNETVQDFYSLVNAKLGVRKNAFGLELWGKNLLNTTYNAFYFESFGNKFFQQGKPLQFGARLTLEI